MKAILVALLFASAAHAETINLGSAAGIGNLDEFDNVPNDAGYTIDIYPAAVIIDGVLYLNSKFQSITLNVVTSRVCTGQGRGQHCSLRYALISGVLVR